MRPRGRAFPARRRAGADDLAPVTRTETQERAGMPFNERGPTMFGPLFSSQAQPDAAHTRSVNCVQATSSDDYQTV